MKKIFILAIVGVVSINFLNAKQLAKPVSKVISVFNAVHVRNCVVNEGNAIKFNWSEPHINATNLGCSLVASRIDRQRHRYVVYTSHNPNGNKTLLNAKPIKYIIDFRCTYKFLGQKKDIKTVTVRPCPVSVDNSVDSLKTDK